MCRAVERERWRVILRYGIGCCPTILRGIMEDMRVKVHLQKNTIEVLGAEKVTGLAFKDGSTLDCGMVVVSAGIRAFC